MAFLIEKKARLPISFVLIGIFISVFVAEVNGLLRRLILMDSFEFTIIVTPITEEILKAIPILIYATMISNLKFQRLRLFIKILVPNLLKKIKSFNTSM